MNFQLIIICSSFFYFAIGEPGFLTTKENEERLQECGKFGSTDPRDMTPWLWVAVFQDKKEFEIVTGATMISPTHLLTSAYAVLRESKEWRNGIGALSLDEKDYLMGSISNEVPNHILSELQIIKHDCMYPPSQTPSSHCDSQFKVKPVKAYILKMCDGRIRKDFSATSAPMIIEIDRPVLKNYASHGYLCLSDDTTRIKESDDVYLYPAESVPEKIMKLQIDSVYNDKVITNYYTSKDWGSPLLKWVDEKWTVIGISTRSTVTLNGNKGFFSNVRWLQEDLCQLTGICGKQLTPIVDPPPTQTPETVTENSTLAEPSYTMATVTRSLFKSTETVPDKTLTIQKLPTPSNENNPELETEPHDYLHDETVFREIEEFTVYTDEKSLKKRSRNIKLFFVFMIVMIFFE